MNTTTIINNEQTDVHEPRHVSTSPVVTFISSESSSLLSTSPRVVSLENLSDTSSSSAASAPRDETPWESLKSASKRKIESVLSSSSDMSDMSTGSEEDDAESPSLSTVRAPGSGSNKKKIKPAEPTAHTLSLHEMHAILNRKSQAVSRKQAVDSSASRPKPKKPLSTPNKSQKNKFSYALNLAIKHGGSSEVIESIVRKSPKVLLDSAEKDGALPIHVLLRYQPKNRETLDMMLLRELGTATRLDSRGNTALHVATQYGAPLQTIQHLVAVNPPAIRILNMNGQTPIDIATRMVHVCADDVVSYLRNHGDTA